MAAKLIGMKTPSLKLDRLQKQVGKSEKTLMHKLAKFADTELKQRTPVDTGKMMSSWKKTPLTVSGKSKSIKIYNTATNPRTGFLYPAALEYGFHHYAWGNYVGFRAGLFYREQTFNATKMKVSVFTREFERTVLRVWK